METKVEQSCNRNGEYEVAMKRNEDGTLKMEFFMTSRVSDDIPMQSGITRKRTDSPV